MYSEPSDIAVLAVLCINATHLQREWKREKETESWKFNLFKVVGNYSQIINQIKQKITIFRKLFDIIDNKIIFIKIFWPMPLFLFSSTHTMHIKSIIDNSIPTFSIKTLYPGGIRTRVLGSWGGCDVHCVTPPGLQ
jgi:hypothetical protein